MVTLSKVLPASVRAMWAAGRVADLAVGHDDTGFGPTLDGVDNVGGAERNVNVGNIVLVKKRGIVRGEANAEDADVIVFKNEMVVGLLRDGDGDGSLRAEGKCEQEQERAEKRFHLLPPSEANPTAKRKMAR
jgi:hypothetical protein